MSTYRTRQLSPPRHRDSHRSSTGNVYLTSHDTLSSGHSGRSTANSVSSRTSNGPYEVRPIRQTTHADGRRTEYVVRPRHNSTAGQENKRPLSIATARQISPRRSLLVASSPREPVSAGLPRDDSSRYLQPASSLAHRQQASHHHHQRHSSTSRAELDRYDPYHDRKDQDSRTRGHEAPRQQIYVTRSQPPRRADNEAWSYTGPREQFDRDYPQHSRRDSHSRRERPLKVYESDREVSSPRRDNHGPPPSASRQLARIERSDNDRYQYRSDLDSESDRPNDVSRRHNSLKPPAVLHQNRDEGYSSARDDYESRGHSRLKSDRYDEDRKGHRSRRDSNRDAEKSHRHAYDYDDHDKQRREEYEHGDKSDHRRKPRSRDPSPDRPHYKDLAAGALGGLATAGTLGTLLGRDGKDKGADSGDEPEKHHRRRRRSRKEDGNSDESDEHRRPHARDDSGGENNEEEHRRRHRPRKSRHHNDDDRNDDDAGDGSSDSQRPHRPRESSHVRSKDDEPDRHQRDMVPSRHADEDPYAMSHRTMSPGENEDDRPRKVMLVEPEKTEATKPRGILKAPRAEPFPEDPNPIREGVAPLKDAKQDGGIPPSARWTKINRVLVNPEALKKANERFEEREDYVIVLRVLSREEIQKLADKTIQIRQARERDWQREIDNGHKVNGGHRDEYGDDDKDTRPRLAIEAAPAGGNDLRNLTQPAHAQQPPQHVQPPPQQQQQQQQQQYPPQSVQQSQQPQQQVPHGQAGNSYGADVNVSQNYSQNV